MKLKDIPVGKLFCFPDDNLCAYVKTSEHKFRVLLRATVNSWEYFSNDTSDYLCDDYVASNRFALLNVQCTKKVVTFRSLAVGTEFNHNGYDYQKIDPVRVRGVEYNTINLTYKTLSATDDDTPISTSRAP